MVDDDPDGAGASAVGNFQPIAAEAPVGHCSDTDVNKDAAETCCLNVTTSQGHHRHEM